MAVDPRRLGQGRAPGSGVIVDRCGGNVLRSIPRGSRTGNDHAGFVPSGRLPADATEMVEAPKDVSRETPASA
jgi:hypothetical protein